MTTTPNELHAIKASVSAALARSTGFNSEGYRASVGLEILAAIDTAAAEAASQRVIMFNADTGEEILPSESATGPVRVIMAAQLLPGMPAELIDKAYSDWLEGDGLEPEPFAVGKTVTHLDAPTLRGKVTERVEDDGELHTVWVRWHSSGVAAVPGVPAPQPYSPRELAEVSN